MMISPINAYTVLNGSYPRNWGHVYGGWLRNPAPVDRWFILVFIGFLHLSTIPGGAGFRWPIHSMPTFTQCFCVLFVLLETMIFPHTLGIHRECVEKQSDQSDCASSSGSELLKQVCDNYVIKKVL